MNNSSNNNDKNCTMINNRGSLLPESTKSSHSQNQKYNNDQESGLNNDGREQERYAPKPASGTGSEVRNNLENERTPLISRQDDRNYMKYGNSTVKQTVFNAVNILMGIAILSLPFAFKYAGWFFGISIFLFCLIQTNYTAKTLKKCLDADPECLTYIDIANLAFGNKGKLFIGALFMLDLFNAAVACMILVGDSLKSLFPNVELVTLKLIVFFIVTPITWMPINLLSHVSIIGIVAASSLAAVIIFDGFAKYEPPGSLLNPMDTHLFPPNWMALPLAFGLINAGFAGHAVFPSLYRDMAKPGSYNKMVNYSYFITGAVYITVAVSGYLMFGSETMEEITLNIMSTPGFSILLNSIVVWLIVINPFCKYPLILVPINLCIEIGFFRMVVLRSKAWKRFYFIFSRTLMSLIIVSVAIFLPEFDRAMSLLGSFFSFLISGIFPLLCYLKIFGRQLSSEEIAWNLFLLVTSSIMAITGTIWTFFPRDWIENS